MLQLHIWELVALLGVTAYTCWYAAYKAGQYDKRSKRFLEEMRRR